MAGQNVETNIGGRRVDEVHRAAGHPVVLAGSAFALGFVTGLFLKEAIKQMREAARGSRWRRGYEGTVTYDENLPDSLGRREPLPEPGQPRYGGTGALGVSPSSAGPTTSGESA